MKFLLNTALALVFLSALPAISRAGDASSLAVLHEINLARTNPHAYAQFIMTYADPRSKNDPRAMEEAVRFLEHAKPLPPLAYSEGLSRSAETHVLDQGSAGTFGHQGTDHSSPFDRMARFGRWITGAGENISYGISDSRQIVISLIVDAGVFGRGHRKNLFLARYAEAGVACGAHAKYGAMCVIDFADHFVPNESARHTAAAHKSAPLITTANIAQNRSWNFGGGL